MYSGKGGQTLSCLPSFHDIMKKREQKAARKNLIRSIGSVRSRLQDLPKRHGALPSNAEITAKAGPISRTDSSASSIQGPASGIW